MVKRVWDFEVKDLDEQRDVVFADFTVLAENFKDALVKAQKYIAKNFKGIELRFSLIKEGKAVDME